jgi:coenzyme F420-0:L-glutamate ligase / coenzyme F420-1:gamma-L-glutamate ligase
MNLAEAVAARRSVRAFKDGPVPHDAVHHAIELAVQAPAPHHSSPWRFALLEGERDKAEFSRAMGVVWHADLLGDGLPETEIEGILSRSHKLLTSTPMLVVCCADMARAHLYRDARRERAEWTLYAHSVGAALQTFMTSLAADGIASCWISAPAFCGDTVKDFLGLAPHVEPQALVLVGYAAPDYEPRPRHRPDPRDYLIPH